MPPIFIPKCVSFSSSFIPSSSSSSSFFLEIQCSLGSRSWAHSFPQPSPYVPLGAEDCWSSGTVVPVLVACPAVCLDPAQFIRGHYPQHNFLDVSFCCPCPHPPLPGQPHFSQHAQWQQLCLHGVCISVLRPTDFVHSRVGNESYHDGLEFFRRLLEAERKAKLGAYPKQGPKGPCSSW